MSNSKDVMDKLMGNAAEIDIELGKSLVNSVVYVNGKVAHVTEVEIMADLNNYTRVKIEFLMK